MDFKLNPSTGDLDLSKGLTLTSGRDEAAQRLQLALGLNLGEFFSHINHGLPWLRNTQEEVGLEASIQYFLGSGVADPTYFIITELDNYLETQPSVRSVTSSYTFDSATRTFTYSPIIVGVDGVEFTLLPYVQQL